MQRSLHQCWRSSALTSTTSRLVRNIMKLSGTSIGYHCRRFDVLLHCLMHIVTAVQRACQKFPPCFENSYFSQFLTKQRKLKRHCETLLEKFSKLCTHSLYNRLKVSVNVMKIICLIIHSYFVS